MTPGQQAKVDARTERYEKGFRVDAIIAAFMVAGCDLHLPDGALNGQPELCERLAELALAGLAEAGFEVVRRGQPPSWMKPRGVLVNSHGNPVVMLEEGQPTPASVWVIER